jgi:hypothetical protein
MRVSDRSVSETKPKSPKFRPDISESESDKRGEDFLFSFSFLFFFPLSLFVGNVGKCGTEMKKDLLFVILCFLK